MYQGKLRKITMVLFVLYALLVVYFLFIGFNRASSNVDQGMRYSLIPNGIPLNFPMGRDFKLWLFNLGNFIAFVPFGIIVPLLFRCSFIRFISLFIVSITILEIVQMVTRLGSFDIDDIMINTLGASVGYWSQRMVKHHRDQVKGMITIILTAIVFSVGTFTVVSSMNHYLTNKGGEVIALDELALSDGSVLWDEHLSEIKIGETLVEPSLNLYSKNNRPTNEFTYVLNGNYTNITGNVAILVDEAAPANDDRIDIIFIADGSEIYGLGYRGGELTTPDSFQIPLQGVNELTIKIVNDSTNSYVVMWDLALTEASRVHRAINRIRSLF